MQLSKLNLALTRIGKAPFTPKSLFSTGAQGVFYDVSDYKNVCFEDSAGTIPITTPLEKPVGLMLDKSKGLVLGSELFSDFTITQSPWVKSGSSWSIDGTQIANKDLYIDPWSLTVGKRYKFTFTVSNASAQLAIYTAEVSPRLFGNGTHVLYVNAAANYIYVRAAPGVSATISNISVRELPGNHAYQSTTTSRPTLSARYNLLTKTEDISNAAWTTLAASVVGTTKFVPSASTTWHAIYQTATLPANTTIRVTVDASAAEYKYLLVSDLNESARGVVFDLNAGTTSLTGSSSVVTVGDNTITALGGGVYRCSCTISKTTASSVAFYSGATAAFAAVGDGTSGINIYKADLRVANDGVGLPAYQRVNTATDYDYAGFPPYLKFDGTDDGMATGNIDFTGTDKMFVAAGVRKLNDTIGGIVLETSTGGSVGRTYIYAGGKSTATGARWTYGSFGTLAGDAETAASFAAPLTNVLTGIGDISGKSSILRVNGAQAASSTSDQGTGNYGNYPLYIGRRGGTTLPFNGRIYSLIVCGKLASAAEIAATETYINAKTKAY